MKKLIKNIKYELYSIPFEEELYLKNPFQFLPEKQSLTKEESDWLDEQEKNKKWIYDPKRIYLMQKRGYSKKDHREVKRQLDSLIKQAESMSLSLPKHFVELVSDYDYFHRINLSDFHFLPAEINVFPEDKNFYIITFLVEQQDLFRWSLVFNKKGQNCIVYNSFPYRDTDPKYIRPNDPAYGSTVCAESIEAFIVWLSVQENQSRKAREGLLSEVS